MAVSQAQLTQLYLAYFGRPPDFDGIQFYTSKPAFTMTTVAAAFSASPESVSMYGAVFGAAQINAIYQNLFNRDAEPAGLVYWTGEVNAGRITPAGAALAILQGAQNDDKVAVNNKLAVATAFTALLDTAAEIIGYSGSIAAASARAFLHTVDSSAASVTAATANLETAVAAAVALGGPAGTTFNLVSGLDNIAGTAGNDVINAAPSATGGTTLDGFDTIDGGTGTDTLNIYFDASANKVQQGTIKNVEIVNIYSSTVYYNGAILDASKFAGATQIWQRGGLESDVSNVAASTLLGFGNSKDVSGAFTAADGVASLNIKLDGIGDGTAIEGSIDTIGPSLTTVNVTGTLAPLTGDFNGIILTIEPGKNFGTVNLNSTVLTQLRAEEDAASTSFIHTVDASGSSGDIVFQSKSGFNLGTQGAHIATIKTGSGDDAVFVNTLTVADDATTTGDETVSAFVSTSAGDDVILVELDPLGTGAATVDAGTGDDRVSVTSRSLGMLTVHLGDGNDRFATSGAAIGGTDLIDGGAGTDTLLLQMVGGANIAAFSNFEMFDAIGLDHALDMDILASKNTVNEIVASGGVGAGAGITNLGAGVNFRATENMGPLAGLALTQKASGALTVTIDSSVPTGDGVPDVSTIVVSAANASSLNAVFGHDSVDKANAVMVLTGTTATSLVVDSGGVNASNTLIYHYGVNATPAGVLTSVTVKGASNLILVLDNGTDDSQSSLTTIDASALTGNLTTDLDNLKAGGVLSLGAGADKVTVTNASTTGAMKTIAGFEKAIASAVAAAPSIPAQADSDKLVLAAAGDGAVLDANAGFAGGTISNGVVTFSGAGPATLAAAVGLVDMAAESVNEIAVFEYVGSTYFFQQSGAGADMLVKLSGVTGVTKLVESGDDEFIMG